MAHSCESKDFRESPHAGTWYPGTELELRQQITTFLDNVELHITGEISGLVSPHAGYIYSGPVAAYAYKMIQDQTFDNVVVIGPSHRYGFIGVSVDTMAGRITPLGTVDFDVDLARAIIACDKHIKYDPRAHSEEHSVEIQIPFLQIVQRELHLVEIVMGTQDMETCTMLSNALVKACKGKRVLLIASSDLSHFHTQDVAEELDNRIVEAVSQYDYQMLFNRLRTDSCEACGGGPIITVMMATKELGATDSKMLHYATSGTVTGDYSQGVVGYLAAVFYKAHDADVGIDLGFSDSEKQQLKDIARRSIEAAVKDKEQPEFKNMTGKLLEPYGVFVTLNKHGNLRGCIGRIIGDQPLYLSCQQMAIAAALEDPRFNPVRKDELDDLTIEISILTPPERITDFSKITIGPDGLIINKGYNRGLLLPQVAVEYGWTAEEFLEQTCHKAGLPSNAYKSPDAEVFKFSAEVF
ncbi:AmmeMemoRadiSam system protein B [candidate division WOR-3 bacterium]|nr:AmmeMemoRadiSam system protein B [candidate division WOR-3 bacterium]